MNKYLKIFLAATTLGILGVWLIPYFLFVNQTMQDLSQITEITNELGFVVERFGNENSWDNDANFRELLNYNDQNQLVEKKYYPLDDDNSEFKIIDSTNFILTKYHYDSVGQLELEQKYQRIDSSGELELFYSYDYKTNKEIIE